MTIEKEELGSTRATCSCWWSTLNLRDRRLRRYPVAVPCVKYYPASPRGCHSSPHGTGVDVEPASPPCIVASFATLRTRALETVYGTSILGSADYYTNLYATFTIQGVPLRPQRRGYHQYEYTHDMVLFLVTYRAPCTSHESYRLPSLMHAQGSLARLCKLPASLVCKQRHQLL